MSEAESTQLAERVLEMLAGRAEASVSVVRTSQGLTRFANSFIHQNVTDEHTTVTLRLTADGRPAGASTYAADDRSLTALVEDTLAAAAVRPVDPFWAGLCPPTAGEGDPDLHYDPVTASIGPDWRAEAVAAFVEAAQDRASGDTTRSAADRAVTTDKTAAGFCETSVTERVLLNTLGHRVADRHTRAAIDGILRFAPPGTPGPDGVGSAYGWRAADIDAAAVGAAAGERARRGMHPINLPAGRYDVVLEPRCVAYLLDFLLVYGFNARAVQEGRSFVSLGEKQLDPALSIHDDALDRRQVGGIFDAEGTPKRPVSLVENGMVTHVTHDRRTAARSGGNQISTGHAVPGGEAFGALAANVFLTSSGEVQPIASLVAGVERGLLVSDFWYARVLDPKSLVATGLTRNGVFLIEGGQVGPAVTNLRYTQSYPAALAPGRVLGIGDDATLAPGDLNFALHHTPSLRLAQWNFTGNAAG